MKSIFTVVHSRYPHHIFYGGFKFSARNIFLSRFVHLRFNAGVCVYWVCVRFARSPALCLFNWAWSMSCLSGDVLVRQFISAYCSTYEIAQAAAGMQLNYLHIFTWSDFIFGVVRVTSRYYCENMSSVWRLVRPGSFNAR